MKKLSLILLVIFSTTTLVGTVYAQNPRSTKSAERRGEAAQRAKDRLEQLRDKRVDSSAELKEKVRDVKRRRAHVFGEISSIAGASFTIETRFGSVKTILTDASTKFLQIGKGGKKNIALKDLTVGNKIAAVGVAKDESSGTASFVVKFIRPEIKRHAVFGKVSKIDENQITIVHIIHTDKPSQIIKVTKDTVIKIKGSEESIISDIKIDDKIAASGIIDEKGVISAKRIFVIPGNAIGTETQPATKSANQ